MIRGLVVDDENKSRENLKILLNEFCEDVEVIGLASTIKEATDIINTLKPDVVFLDIQMHKETGFDLLEQFDKINFEVIFTTAHSEFALKAIKFSAVDYLLKPIDINELQWAIEKVKNKIKNKSFSKANIDLLLQNLKPHTEQKYKLALPTSNGLVFVKLKDIIYCEADSNYTNIYTQDGKKHIVSKTLKEYDELLHEHNFFRIHKSYLINVNEIKEYIRGEGGYVIMNNSISLDVSKRRKDEFLKLISKIN